MFWKGKQHVEIFVFISRSKTTHIASFLFFDSCFSAAQVAKISLLTLIVVSLDNHLVLHARCRSFFFIVVWCIARQADRSDKTVKDFFHNCIKVLSQFRTPYCTNFQRYSNRPKRGGAHDNAQIPNLQLRRQKIVSAYNIAAVRCNSHVQENMLSSNRYTSMQGKTIS